MSRPTITKQQIWAVLNRSHLLLNEDIEALRKAHITKEMAQELHAQVKELIDDANTLGIVNKDALILSGAWIGDEPQFVDFGKGTHCRKIRRTKATNYRSGSTGYLEHFHSLVSHIFNAAKDIEDNGSVAPAPYARKHAPDWKPSKLAA